MQYEPVRWHVSHVAAPPASLHALLCCAGTCALSCEVNLHASMLCCASMLLCILLCAAQVRAAPDRVARAAAADARDPLRVRRHARGDGPGRGGGRDLGGTWEGPGRVPGGCREGAGRGPGRGAQETGAGEGTRGLGAIASDHSCSFHNVGTTWYSLCAWACGVCVEGERWGLAHSTLPTCALVVARRESLTCRSSA